MCTQRQAEHVVTYQDHLISNFFFSKPQIFPRKDNNWLIDLSLSFAEMQNLNVGVVCQFSLLAKQIFKRLGEIASSDLHCSVRLSVFPWEEVVGGPI